MITFANKINNIDISEIRYKIQKDIAKSQTIFGIMILLLIILLRINNYNFIISVYKQLETYKTDNTGNLEDLEQIIDKTHISYFYYFDEIVENEISEIITTIKFSISEKNMILIEKSVDQLIDKIESLFDINSNCLEIVLLSIFNPAIIIMFISTLLSLLTYFYDNIISKIFQVSIISGYCFLTIFNDINDLTKIFLLVIALIISIQYGFLTLNFKLKISIILTIFIVLVIARSIYVRQIFKSIAIIFITVISIQIIFSLFIHEINAYQKVINENNGIVTIGKNASQFLHNLNNIITSMILNDELLEVDNVESVNEYIMSQKKFHTQIEEMTRLLLNNLRQLRSYERKMIQIEEIIKSCLVMLQLDSGFRNSVNVTEKLNVKHEISASASDLFQIFHNLLKNSYEAILETKKAGNISLETYEKLNFIIFKIKDSGIGISDCNCKDTYCNSCRRFAYGKTSKKHGNGLGMVYVINVLNEMDAKIKIKSKFGIGTEISIYFKKY